MRICTVLPSRLPNLSRDFILPRKEAAVAARNPCAKTVKPDNAFEVWRVDDHREYGDEWTWYVLKKYQTPEKEAVNSYASWNCMVTFPNTSVRGDSGGVYVTDITSIAYKLVL